MSNLDLAVDLIDRDHKSRVSRQSQTYETAPVGLREQPAFLNRVVELESERMPGELVEVFLEIERRLGRERDVPGGPRVIDLDLLLYHDWIQSTVGVVVPHPRMDERRFVLIPLVEIADGLRNPHTGEEYSAILERINVIDQSVEIYRG
jgi:2-amino-4-hydroxy-6-hydroxymethyldihydropteridine diphosphokinase